MSADGLYVLVSGGMVPTLLLTGELGGAGPVMVSAYTEDTDWYRTPFLWILFQTLLVISASS